MSSNDNDIYHGPASHSNIYNAMILADRLGFKNYTLIIGLLNSKRILINDFNKSNPYPRALAINIHRDKDELGDYL